MNTNTLVEENKRLKLELFQSKVIEAANAMEMLVAALKLQSNNARMHKHREFIGVDDPEEDQEQKKLRETFGVDDDDPYGFGSNPRPCQHLLSKGPRKGTPCGRKKCSLHVSENRPPEAYFTELQNIHKKYVNRREMQLQAKLEDQKKEIRQSLDSLNLLTTTLLSQSLDMDQNNKYVKNGIEVIHKIRSLCNEIKSQV